MASALDQPLEVSDLMIAGAAVADGVDGRGDWRTLRGIDNLLQALWLRLNTPEGALAALGHADYGSRLHLLIGELDTPEVRDRARLYVLRALHREPRVAQVVAVQVESGPRGTGRSLEVRARVRAVGGSRPLDFGFPVFLEPA